MAHAGRFLSGALLVVGVASLAQAAGPCEEAREHTGLGLVPTAGGVGVAAVDAGSGAAAGGLERGDLVVQVNAVVVHTCGEYARAVRDARRDQKALLVLVRRGAAELPVVLAAAVWERAVASAPPVAPAPGAAAPTAVAASLPPAVPPAPPPPAEPPSVRAVVEKPPAVLPPAAHVTVDELTRELAALTPPRGDDERAMSAYRAGVSGVRGQVETLARQGDAPPEVISGLSTVLRYYDAAGVAWASAEAQRERERRPRHLPHGEAVTAAYFSESEIAAVIDEFPFLGATVVRPPREALAFTESAGLWRPREARALLWTHGREELDRLSTWLAAGSR